MLHGARFKLCGDYDQQTSPVCIPLCNQKFNTDQRMLEGKFWVPEGMDYSRAGATLSATGGAAFNTDIEIVRGGALTASFLTLNGSTDYLDASGYDGDLADQTVAIDIVGRFRGLGDGLHQNFIGNKLSLGGSEAGWCLRKNTSDFFSLHCGDGTNGASALFDGSAILDDGEFHRITGLWDPPNNRFDIFLDGLYQDAKASSGWTHANVVNTNPLRLGATGNAGAFSNIDVAFVSIRYGDKWSGRTLIESEGALPRLQNLDPTTDLWWDFDEGEGTVVHSYPHWRRNFWRFDGSTGNASAAHIADYNGTYLTCDAAIRSEDMSVYKEMGARGAYFVFRVAADGRVSQNVHTGVTFHDVLTGSGTGRIKPYNVHQIRAAFDPTTAISTLFVDGVQVFSAAHAGWTSDGFPSLNNPSTALDTGHWAGTGEFKGNIYYSRVWDANLTAESGVNAPALDYGSVATLQSQQLMDDQSSAPGTIFDSSPNANNATVTGTTSAESNSFSVAAGSPVWTNGNEVVGAGTLTQGAAGTARTTVHTGPFAVTAGDRIWVQARQNSGAAVLDSGETNPNIFWIEAVRSPKHYLR